MSNSISSGAFATFSANKAHLYSSYSNAFSIHQHNGFIKTTSPKSKIKKLTKAQTAAFKKKINHYKAMENRSILVSAAITLVVSAGVLILSSEFITSMI